MWGILPGFVLPSIALAGPEFIPRPAATTIGITGGYNRTFHSGFIDGPFMAHDGPLSAPPGAGGGNGFHVGLAFEQRLPIRLVRPLPALYLHINVTYNRSPAEIDPVEVPIDPWFVINARGLLPARRTTSVTYDMVKLDLLLRQMILPTSSDYFSGFSISAGPTFGYLLQGRARHTLAIDDFAFTPSYARTLDATGRVATLSDESIDGIRKVRYGLKGGISFETAIARNMIVLSPSISYDYALGSGSDDANWRADILQGALDVRFDLPKLWRKLFIAPVEDESNPL